MAPKASRFHPYRATSDVETPGGIQSYSWFVGPGLLPAGIDPPPDRPILIIVDYSPLPSLTHPSERDHAMFSALANHNFRCATAGELEALFTWTRLFPPDEANAIQFSHLRPQLTTRLRTQWDIQMIASDLEFVTPTSPEMFFKFVKIGLSCSSWTSTDLIGELDNIIIWNPLFRVLNNPLFFG